ncbi:hypothetical protein HERIO_1224 [Hepatospora eriocheir]|uniref:Uncharacterized protein n=1 Tax=Hepatospora eriocheir TaxID=1081669 RepID=A0A1X0QAV1_9MICR|nr:hypothetical protein HERIO_1224 [Hepatospora eriocheir]
MGDIDKDHIEYKFIERSYFDEPCDNSLNVNGLKKPILKQMKFWLFLIGLIMIFITSYAFYDFYKKNYKNSEIIKNNQLEQKDVPVTYTEFSKDLMKFLKDKWNITTPFILFKGNKCKECHNNIVKRFRDLQISNTDENH